ncbi:DUF3515 domain-containing protein [Amycolatopsis pittospori]|uniref:DUF3515 domain-containing protein n=1 Tax=Amycolatopsis pittospori TaxID=2749434 RepID=UPI0015F0A5AF|nr:DUF3515 domain-containing protein [Amycolatopsis pittospori]
MADTDTGAPPKPLLIAAACLAVLLFAGVAVFGLTRGADSEAPAADAPLPLVPVEAPQSGTPECAKLIGGLPHELTSAGNTLVRRKLADPAPQATVGWGTGDPVVLRCGLGKPPELTRTSQLRTINGVQWLQVEGEGAATWFVVDRPVYTALTVPNTAGTGPLQTISEVVAANLPPAPLRF